MIFVGGIPRSGTSVLMQCLRNSGYYIGEDRQLNGHKYQSEYTPMNMTLNWMFHGQEFITQCEWSVLHNVATYAVLNKIEALKSFNFCFVGHLLKEHAIFEDAKFIIMSRDLEEAVASGKRLNDFKHSVQAYKGYLAAWDKLSEGYPALNIDHGDVINHTEDVKKKLSDFLGRDIDMSIVSRKETFAESGDVH